MDYPAHDTVFTWAAPPLRIGLGAVDETAFELSRFAPRRVLLLTDAGLTATGWPDRLAALVRAGGMDCQIYDGVHVEPTDHSMTEAVAAARDSGPWDAFLALGGGSVMDTAKVVNLLSTNPGELTDYLNPPLGAGRSPVHPLRPLIAVPTTAGTGAECTAVAILDMTGLRVKSGISSPQLRPVAAIIDPQLTMSLNPQVTAAGGMDVLCHAVESLTARTYDAVARKRPEERTVYCGANPISDMWTEHALILLASALRLVVRDGDDVDARTKMTLAATYAGMGFGNAGVHLPHAGAYPIAGQVPRYHAEGYPGDEPLVPHGQAVSLTAPAAFRFTFAAAPQRHLRAAALLDPGVADLEPSEQLPTALVRLMRDIGIPNGIGAVGFTESDIDALVAGTRAQQRLLAQAPVPPTDEDLAAIFHGSIQNW
jgi:alcohol dehydrogenase class IV